MRKTIALADFSIKGFQFPLLGGVEKFKEILTGWLVIFTNKNNFLP
jgi:hypothetical protein